MDKNKSIFNPSQKSPGFSPRGSTRKRILGVFLLGIQAVLVFNVSASLRETPVVEVVRENAAGVVNISTEQIVLLRENPYWGSYGGAFDLLFKEFFGIYGRMQALKLKSVGSGVILDREGVIITNAHVVNMASNIFIVLSDGTSIEGKVEYEDFKHDLAIVKVEPSATLKEIKLGDTDDIMIGETVVAIGNPLGLENSVTVGVISGKNRKLYSPDGGIISEELLQTDTPINPGSSGGALLNLDGELIGINVAVVQNSQSIGFAIPVREVKKSLKEYQILQESKENSSLSSKKTLPSRLIPAREEWDPFLEMEEVEAKMQQMLQSSFSRSSGGKNDDWFDADIFYDTNLDIQQDQAGYTIRVDIAGLDKSKINLEIDNNLIKLSGEYSEVREETAENSFYQSQRSGSFLRTIPLPADADVQKVKTNIEGDILIITFPKTAD